MRVFGFCAAVVGVLGSGGSWSDVRLPNVIGDGMVIQRNARVTVWGWADPGEIVRIAFHGAKVRATADKKGCWKASFGPLGAGGPYDMTVQGRNRLLIRNILVGDVWLASGQSNMQFPVKGGEDRPEGVNNADVEIASANFPNVRMITIKHAAAAKPQWDVNTEGWRAVTSETVVSFSAVAYLFGRELHERYHVPIGLIQSTWGGTAAEAWMSESAVLHFPDFRPAVDSLARVDGSTQESYNHYQQMKTLWDRDHGTEDHGRVDGRDVWADPNFDVSAWPTIDVPRPTEAWGKDFGGFNGVVWFRRTIELSPEQAGKALTLHLGKMLMDDVTYFNGKKIGATQGFFNVRDYVVPGKYVRADKNVISVRLVGVKDPDFPFQPGVGMYGSGDEMRAETGRDTLSLAGSWSYHLGSDLQDYPTITAAIMAAHPIANTPTALFNGMINPLIAFRIKGVIWYQGESNTDRPIQYRTLLPALIDDWRRQWGYQFPFLFVQLAGFGAEQPESAECKWAELREAQAMALAVPNTGMATAIDVGEATDVHPRNKQGVAHRLVLAAAKLAYGENIVYSGPVYQSMQIEGDWIRLKFSELGSGLLIKDKYGYGRGFEVASADGEFHWAQARQDGQDIIVAAGTIQTPVAVRYDWSNTPDGNVFNVEGLPASPFRTGGPK